MLRAAWNLGISLGALLPVIYEHFVSASWFLFGGYDTIVLFPPRAFVLPHLTCSL
jgi:hypothetical protein